MNDLGWQYESDKLSLELLHEVHDNCIDCMKEYIGPIENDDLWSLWHGRQHAWMKSTRLHLECQRMSSLHEASKWRVDQLIMSSALSEALDDHYQVVSDKDKADLAYGDHGEYLDKLDYICKNELEDDEVQCMKIWDALFYKTKKASFSRHPSLDLVDTSGLDRIRAAIRAQDEEDQEFETTPQGRRVKRRRTSIEAAWADS